MASDRRGIHLTAFPGRATYGALLLFLSRRLRDGRIGAGLNPGTYAGIACQSRTKCRRTSGGDDFVVEAAGGDD
jgi:hypothetical protein